MHETDIRKLAEQIANLIAVPRVEDSALQASINKIEGRLESLESAISNSTALRQPKHSLRPESEISNLKSEISDPRASHPSIDKFNIAEAIVDGLFARQTKEKACTFEPSRPCDHCSMCNSRGF